MSGLEVTSTTAISPVRRFRIALGLFIAGLVFSGITAFPLRLEIRLITRLLGAGATPEPDGHGGLLCWLLTVRQGLEQTDARYPWMAYGTDWLAFGHLVIHRPVLRRSAPPTGLQPGRPPDRHRRLCRRDPAGHDLRCHPRHPAVLAAGRLLLRRLRRPAADLLSAAPAADRGPSGTAHGPAGRPFLLTRTTRRPANLGRSGSDSIGSSTAGVVC